VAELASWTDGPTRAAIVDFVRRVTAEVGPDYVAPEARIAVFDNDGTLWCEKPMYIQLDFLLRRFKEQAEADPSLRDQQPYKAAYSGDLKWLGDAVTKHYQGDDTDMKPLMGAILTAHHQITVEEHAARVNAFFAEAKHPTLGRPYTSCGYAPMVELLRYLEANDFICYIVSGGGRDFMRPVTGPLYGVPPERVVGSSVGLVYRDGHLYTTDQPEFLDDGSNRCGCGAGSGVDRSWLAATPTATSKCWSSPAACGCSCCTMTPIANSTTPQGPRSHWIRHRRTAGPSSA